LLTAVTEREFYSQTSEKNQSLIASKDFDHNQRVGTSYLIAEWFVVTLHAL